LVERAINGGVAGLFVLGTTGEGPHLSYRLRRELITHACRFARQRVPVLVGVTDTSVVELLGVSRHAAEVGAQGLVLAPPYYLFVGQPEFQEYLSRVVPELPLPVFLYNFPALTKVVYEMDTVKRMLDQPNVAGMKDSSGNMTYFHRLVAAAKPRPDWTLVIGPEELLEDAIFAGGHGGVNGGANLFPELYVALHRAAKAGDHARVRLLKSVVMDVSENIYHVGRHESSIIKGIKCGLRCLGVCDDFMTEPFNRFREPERTRVAQLVERIQDRLKTVL
jgi:4-hydroxy-tetrahydrodipicolinate synthase